MACITSCCCECFAHQSSMDGDLKPRFLCRSFSPPLSCRWLGCHQKSVTPLQRSAAYKVYHGLPANCICRRYLLKQKGFYGVSYYIGFRDEFDVKVSSLRPPCVMVSPISFPDQRHHRAHMLHRRTLAFKTGRCSTYHS